jgi:hypothetical protein
VRIAARDDGSLVVQAEANRFFLLNRAYGFQRSVDVVSRAAEDKSTIEKIFTWAPTKTDIIAFAEVKTPAQVGQGEQWSSGVVRFPLDGRPQGGFRFLANLSINDVSRKFHKLGYSFSAALGETGYIILMGDGFRLYKSEKGQAELQEMKALGTLFPPAKGVPILPAFVHPEDYPLLMKEVEKASMPAGLYGWRGFLYVLSRQPQSGGTQWRLSKIDPVQDRILGTVILPSRANHLFAVPGSQWTFVEKGPALGQRDQQVRGTISLSSKAVDEAFSRATKSSTQVTLSLCP